MKGLVQIPSQTDFVRAYSAAQSSPESVASNDFALWSQWARFDPRLGEILTEFIARNWMRFSPQDLNRALLVQPWPESGALLLEHAKLSSEIENDRELFLNWVQCATSGIEPAQGEQYFIGTRKFAGEVARDDVIFSITPYLRWGYFGRDVLLHRPPRNRQTLLPINARKLKLNKLMRSLARFTVSQYIDALDGWVTRRQAQLDIQNFGKVKAHGKTRARVYRKK